MQIKRKISYTGRDLNPEILNELLEAMVLGMLRQISANIQNATFFMTMADERADVSNKVQLVTAFGVG